MCELLTHKFPSHQARSIALCSKLGVDDTEICPDAVDALVRSTYVNLKLERGQGKRGHKDKNRHSDSARRHNTERSGRRQIDKRQRAAPRDRRRKVERRVRRRHTDQNR